MSGCHELCSGSFKPMEGILSCFHFRFVFLVPRNQGLCLGENSGQVGRGDLAHIGNDLVGPGHQLPVVVEVPLDLLVEGGGERNVLLGACLDVDLLDQTRVGHHLK